jgi:hypothetical protein
MRDDELVRMLEETLDALGMMYTQYCSRDGHLFMSAGEYASNVLEHWGMLNADEAGRGEVRDVDPKRIRDLLSDNLKSQ